MQYGTFLLSKVIDGNDPAALTRYGITERDFPSDGEREVFRFVRDYAEQNRGQSPGSEVVAAKIPDFARWYAPQIGDSYEFLVREIKGHTALTWLTDLINGTREESEKNKPGWLERTIKENSDGAEVLKLLREKTEQAIIGTNVLSKVGTDVKSDGSSFLDEYRKRKAGESFKIWRSKFPSINEQIGGYLSGNMFTWYGRSGRGKSIFTMEEIVEAAAQGANVLVWAMEMSRFEWMARAYSSISARAGIAVDMIDGTDYEVGFENKQLITGKLSDEFEAGLEVFLMQMAEGEHLAGNITLRAADDVDFYKRGISQLEADIHATKADVVLVDPIYLMDYEANTSKTAGGDVANTSKKLRRLAGQTGVTMHIITQAEEVRDETDEDGNRELRAPKRSEIKKTKAVLEDATNTFGIDSLDGEGIIEIGKGRNGGEGTKVSVLYLPNYGIVREMDSGEAAAKHFDF
ncbi:DnaB-like helicase C-terminal domain-containing protein [Cytobacillus purgationiresistens]|uniref:Replicative DNA helicase n=1 Tax=Cytobacillus purgationiresistens TaxID=863449 RepID=A0ABU0AHT0_9BACI|nr:DnaB-like helicase C-terminal domain-containing protein [Cytobacillus purgationiresistens]MDQ0270782.1 replicative DNA helicase [Cytobacillus purgationiresistens]